MRKAAFFLLFITGSINSIAQTNADTTGFKKASDGSEYKILSVKDSKSLARGNYMELQVMAKYKDSILYNTKDDGMPQFGLYDTANFPVPFKEVFNTIKVGDSIIVKVSTDSIIAKGQAAPFIQKGQFLCQYYTITNSYTTKQQVDSAQQTHLAVANAIAKKKQTALLQGILVENKDKIAADGKIIEAYLAKNKIKATRAPWGTYIAVKKESMGKQVTEAGFAAVNYTGKSFTDGKVFDSNTDPKFQHVQPYNVNMGQLSGVILGWYDALFQMKQGTKATIYIPSTLGYGKQGNPQGGINPDAILVFDMEVVAVGSEAQIQVMLDAKAKHKPKAQAKPNTTPAKTQPKKTTTTAKPKTKPTTKMAGQ